VEIKRLPEPYDECVDTTSGQHDFTRNVYEEIYPETLYSLEVSSSLINKQRDVTLLARRALLPSSYN